jgi:hypothetical protein
VEKLALLAAVVALVVAGILGWEAPRDIGPAWRLAVFACLQPAIGSLIFILIFRLTAGQWMENLAPFLLAGARLLPWVWLLVLPLLWLPLAGVPGGEADTTAGLQHAFQAEASRHLDAGLRFYFSKPFLTGRAVFYAAMFFALAVGAGRGLRRNAPALMPWFGPAGLIVLVFTLHLLATDWFLLLDPGWYSTGFPLVWTAGQAVSGLAGALLASLWAGGEPGSRGGSGRPRGLDWGNLMLAAVMAWTYVAFVQWLIIWSGNLPAETAWYRHRAHGGWLGVVVVLALLEFALPFALLLSRGVKQHRGSLALAAGLVLAGQFVYTLWMIVPAAAPVSGHAAWLDAAAVAAVGAFFLNRYLAGARVAAAQLSP